MLQPRIKMCEPSNSDNISNDCLIFDKMGCSSELCSGRGDIVKVTRGISTPNAISAEKLLKILKC